MVRWRIAWALIFALALAAAFASVRPAHGKGGGDSWIMAGAALNRYAAATASAATLATVDG
jgi:hypothetical protein